MKPKASKLLILILIACCLFGAASRAQAWSWWNDPGPLVFVQPRVLIGYMLPTQNFEFNINTIPSFWTNSATPPTTYLITSSLKSFLQSAKMDGVPLELVIPVKTVFPIGFTTTLGYLVPANNRVQETYLSDYPGNPEVARVNWNIRTTVYNIKFSIDYTFSESLTGMLGFVYDSFMTTYSKPENILPPNNSYINPAQQGRLDISVGVPFGGIRYERNLWSRLDLKTHIIASPFMPGVISYRELVNYSVKEKAAAANFVRLESEISSGYFYEAFAQLSTPIWRGIGAGAFVKYSEYSCKLQSVDVVYKEKTGTETDAPLRTDCNFMRNPIILGANITALF